MDIQEDQAYCGMRVCFKSLNSMLESSAAIPKSVKVFLKRYAKLEMGAYLPTETISHFFLSNSSTFYNSIAKKNYIKTE